jgi:hypothetical protein
LELIIQVRQVCYRRKFIASAPCLRTNPGLYRNGDRFCIVRFQGDFSNEARTSVSLSRKRYLRDSLEYRALPRRLYSANDDLRELEFVIVVQGLETSQSPE